MISLKTKKHLDAVQNHAEGEYAYVEDEKRIYQYCEADGGWGPIDAGTEINTGMTLYEVNQNVVNNLPALDEYELVSKEKLIEKFIKDKGNKYYMLLNNELHYYTVFACGLFNAPKDNAPIQREITNCLFHIGEIKSVELTEDKHAIEIWITREGEEKFSHVFYLFPYDNGVIECE